MEATKNKILLIFMAICGIVSLLPYLTLEYYEFAYPFIWTLTYLNLPLAILTIFYSIRFTKQYIKSQKRKVSRFLYIVLFSFFFQIGLTFFSANSFVLMDAFIGKQTQVELKEPILSSHFTTNKMGSRQYYIDFKHPTEHRIVTLAVNRDYLPNEQLNLTMEIGSLGLLNKK